MTLAEAKVGLEALEELAVNPRGMRFIMQHRFWAGDKPVIFSDATAPDWLTSKRTVRGSTTDNRSFWESRVLTLSIGKRVQTDFRTITRIK